MVNITDKEWRLLELLRHNDVKTIANKMGTNPHAVYMAKSRIRKKRRQLFDLLSRLKPYQKLLAFKTKQIEEPSEEEETIHID